MLDGTVTPVNQGFGLVTHIFNSYQTCVLQFHDMSSCRVIDSVIYYHE